MATTAISPSTAFGTERALSSSSWKHPEHQLACFVDLQYNPFQRAGKGANPLKEYLSDELYQLLRANDIINEKGLRDFLIRRIFRQLKESQSLSTPDAIQQIKELYPYLQLDTIRKIVYKVYPTRQRKMMI
jgi:hypothetical protein